MRLCELLGLKNRFDFDGTHEEYYEALVQALGYDDVAACVPFPVDVLDAKMKHDMHFNNLPIGQWDRASGFMNSGASCLYIGSPLTRLYRGKGVTTFSCSEGVCILKECAREMVAAYREEKAS